VRIFWKILAAALAATAVAFVVVSNYEQAFLCAAAGACAWLLSYRTQLKEKLAANEVEPRSAIEEDANEEDL
jgi:uncharacterized membrane protein YjjB (DUF3815 family)